MLEAMSGKYVHLRRGIITAYESFSVRKDGEWKAACGKNTVGPEYPANFMIETALDETWRVSALEAKLKTRSREISSSYRWCAGGWGGGVSETGRNARDCHIPMVEGLEVCCPLAFFDGLLFRRLGLLAASQIRIELLEVQEESLETVQTYRIIERLEDEPAQWRGQNVSASRYRITDPFGEMEGVWVHPRGACLWRRTAGGEERYRLMEFSEA
ncbi:MAG TPA: hypothetical protein VNK24_02840 [Elusimicrobiota bacterium]|nr:hypothetical protein [Elusimicrobiota bacterium]